MVSREPMDSGRDGTLENGLSNTTAQKEAAKQGTVDANSTNCR